MKKNRVDSVCAALVWLAVLLLLTVAYWAP